MSWALTAAMALIPDVDELEDVLVLGMVREILPLLLAIVVALWVASSLLAKPSKSSSAPCAARHSNELRLCGPEVQTLTFFGQELNRFVEEVERIYDVAPAPVAGEAQRPRDFVAPRDVRESIRQMRAACAHLQEAGGGTWRLHEPLDDVFYVRNLLAADFHHARAVQLVRNYVRFRQEMRGGIPPDYAWLKAGIAVVPFSDLSERPVFLARAKHFDAHIDAELFRAFYRGMVDSVIAHLLLKRQGLSKSNPLEQYVLVLDVRGATRQNFSMTGIQVMIAESNTYYPDRVAQIYVLGANMAVRGLWSIVSPMVQPRTRKKTHLIAAADVPALMRRLVDPSELPLDFGGQAPEICEPCAARSLCDMAGRISAETWERLGAAEVLKEKEALASKICATWDLPYGFRPMSSFKLWLQSRGENTAISRSTSDCADFLAELQHSAELKRIRLDLPKLEEDGCGTWLSACMGLRARTEEELRALQATKQPEVFARCLGQILSESQGAAGRAVLDFVSGSGPYTPR